MRFSDGKNAPFRWQMETRFPSYRLKLYGGFAGVAGGFQMERFPSGFPSCRLTESLAGNDIFQTADGKILSPKGGACPVVNRGTPSFLLSETSNHQERRRPPWED